MATYEFFEHTADTGVIARGASLNEAFAQAAIALFDIITGKATIASRDVRRFEIESIDLEGLLVGFLSKLLYLFETDGLVFGRFDVQLRDNCTLAAAAYGEPFDPARHADGIQVKAVSYHMIRITEPRNGTPASVRVLFDV